MAKVKSYLDWEPILEPADVFSNIKGLGSLCISENGKMLYWHETKPDEKHRLVLMELDQTKNKIREITPKEYYIRTRVHEYGGNASVIFKNDFFFVNFADQRIYQQNIINPEQIKAITIEKNKDNSLGKYADFSISPDGKFLLFVYEQEFATKENENKIAYLKLPSKEDAEPKILVEGNDFYANPKFSKDMTKFIWISWDHPNMPWDNTSLWVADLTVKNDKIVLENKTKIAGNEGQSITNAEFGPNGNIYFIMDYPGMDEDDYKNWWNIYEYDYSEIRNITQNLYEHALPAWGLGQKNFQFIDSHKILVRYFATDKSNLKIVDLKTKKETILNLPYTDFDSLQYYSNIIYFTASSPTEFNNILKYDLGTKKIITLRKSTDTKILNKNDISIPELITFETGNNETAFGYFYYPKNPNFSPKQNERPPCVVMVHGGPTANTGPDLSLSKQFFCSNGFAVFDIDHRGSTGYGRKFRDKLLGQWGEVDAEDVNFGIKYLIDSGKIADKVVIRGGSAGGYAVQRALTKYPNLFKAGASYYGIGSLVTLAKLTHKFESRYLDQMIGGTLEEAKEIYEKRSPINQMDKLIAPMILFQGSDDKVVMPEVSREIVKILQEKGIKHDYVEYEGEAHGFRDKNNNIDALTKEIKFYKEILKSV